VAADPGRRSGTLAGRRTVARAVREAARRLARAGVREARTNAELLLADLVGTDRGGLLPRRADVLDGETVRRFEERVARRERRIPLQHVIGSQEFYGVSFRADGRALIPRPETEGLIDAALELDLPAGAHAADLGTGSGCLAIVLALKLPTLRLHALDRSLAALELARENAAAHAVGQRIEFVRGDFATPVPAWHGRMDLVLANPPYVAEGEWSTLEPEVRDHDPRGALIAGPSGIESYSALLPAARVLLRPGGHLILELGHGQADRVSALVAAAGLCGTEVRPDLRGIPRVLLARRPA
jgi:release factor glutamine methyltransferase